MGGGGSWRTGAGFSFPVERAPFFTGHLLGLAALGGRFISVLNRSLRKIRPMAAPREIPIAWPIFAADQPFLSISATLSRSASFQITFSGCMAAAPLFGGFGRIGLVVVLGIVLAIISGGQIGGLLHAIGLLLFDGGL